MIYAVIDTNVFVSALLSKHFPKTPIVVTPAEMLEILEKEGLMP